jgi:hypothetical protein
MKKLNKTKAEIVMTKSMEEFTKLLKDSLAGYYSKSLSNNIKRGIQAKKIRLLNCEKPNCNVKNCKV